MKQVTITECDLQAYVDDQLDAAGRLEVADYLVRHPDIAARVLADLRFRDAMRALAEENGEDIPARLVDEARRLDAALGKRRPLARLGRFAPLAAAMAVAMIVVATWQNIDLAPRARATVPTLVQEALMSQKTAEIRARMPSQPETTHFDAKAMRRATRIEVPALPADWRILDAQLFPSDYGPSVQMVIDTGGDQPVSLFAARTSADFPEEPQTEVVDGQAVGYWSHEGTVYALTGDQPADLIAAHAEDLASSQDS
ncbi:anti-sigma factor [Sphingopyxis sp.]|uniref:anti-sigma factor family protein n=1 Tax=Sphingopyxis sp. TaxID=1908224 RepID=UPI0035B35E7D